MKKHLSFAVHDNRPGDFVLPVNPGGSFRAANPGK